MERKCNEKYVALFEEILRNLYLLNKPIGEVTNRKLIRDFRIYLAVGGMPQAVEAYVEKNHLKKLSLLKEILFNYTKMIFKKIDSTGKIGRIYDAIPSQLALHRKRFFISAATSSRHKNKNAQLLSKIIDSKNKIREYGIFNLYKEINYVIIKISKNVYLHKKGERPCLRELKI